jgi:hypothetical protein
VAEKLTIYQGTPNWVIPRADAPIPRWRRALFKYVPPIWWRYRAEVMDFNESLYHVMVDRSTPWSNVLVKMSHDMMKEQLPNQPDLCDMPCIPAVTATR